MLLYKYFVADAEQFPGFDAGHARICRQTIKMVEACGWRPRRQVRVALLGKVFLEPEQVRAGVRVARGDGTARARIAALKVYVADSEAHRAARVIAKELVFPERWDAFNFQVGAKAQAHLIRAQREPFRH